MAKESEKASATEDRIDEYAIGVFESIGIKGRLPDSLVSMYLEFKTRKDRMTPGNLSPEGFAMVLVLADLSDGKIEFGKS